MTIICYASDCKCNMDIMIWMAFVCVQTCMCVIVCVCVCFCVSVCSYVSVCMSVHMCVHNIHLLSVSRVVVQINIFYYATGCN